MYLSLLYVCCKKAYLCLFLNQIKKIFLLFSIRINSKQPMFWVQVKEMYISSHI